METFISPAARLPRLSLGVVGSIVLCLLISLISSNIGSSFWLSSSSSKSSLRLSDDREDFSLSNCSKLRMHGVSAGISPALGRRVGLVC